MSASHLLVKLSKKSLPWMVLSIILGFSSAIFNGVGITLIIPLVMSFLELDILESEGLPPLLKTIFSSFDVFPEQSRILVMMGCVVLAIVLKNLANYANSITSGILSREFTATLRKEGFRLLLDVDISYFSGVKLGDLMNYINSEVNRASTAVRALIRVIIAAITIFVFFGILVLISWQLTLIAALLLGAIALVNQLSLKHAKRVGRELSRAAAALSSRAIEVLSGIRLVKSSANEDVEYATLKRLIARRQAAEYRSQLIYASVAPVNEITSIFALLGLIVAGKALFGSQMQAFSSIILTYLVVLSRMLPFIGQLNTARNQLANSSASVEIIQDFLRRDNKPIMHSGRRLFSGLDQEIQFKQIWFQYPNSDGWSLQNISLTLPKGQMMALVGASGAGKSTLADLLARFYEPTKGQLEIDGVDLTQFDVNHYRRQIGIVSQDTFLFNASIRDNIRYGRAQASDEDVFQAAQQANALEFIQKLPDGFDTLIGDRGVLLSGGQRQRLAIARALLQDPDILILDEATSALDTISERLVQKALEDLSKSRTTLVIAHRLSTVQNADQIVVLDKGKIVEVGTHRELLRRGKHYASLYSIQFSENQNGHTNGKAIVGDSGDLSLDSLGEISYEIRSQLNGMIGVLGFLNNDELLEDNLESQELMERAYQSALNILQTVEKLEDQVVPSK